jgi:hypothetical protein
MNLYNFFDKRFVNIKNTVNLFTLCDNLLLRLYSRDKSKYGGENTDIKLFTDFIMVGS